MNPPRPCYDCGQPFPSAEQRKAGAAPHVCVELAEPEAGTSFVLSRYEPDPTGFMGSFAVDIVKDGKTIAGVLHDRGSCERLLRIRGFRGPFSWPTPAESRAQRLAARRAMKGGA